jgi:hypothetical protein
VHSKAVYQACLLTCIVVLAVLFILVAPDQQTTDTLSGVWTGDWGATPVHRNLVTLELKWDGKTLTGMVNPGEDAIALQETSFDASTGAMHVEVETGSVGNIVRYIIEGKVENGVIIGSWNHDDKKGDFKVIKKRRN